LRPLRLRGGFDLSQRTKDALCMPVWNMQGAGRGEAAGGSGSGRVDRRAERQGQRRCRVRGGGGVGGCGQAAIRGEPLGSHCEPTGGEC